MVGSVPVCMALDDPEDPSQNDPADIPIDGGLSLLLAAGAVYGAKRLHRHAPLRRNEDPQAFNCLQEKKPV